MLDRAWENLTVTYDPIASALETVGARTAFDAGTTESRSTSSGIYDLRLLNAVLADLGLDPVSAGGLGED